jgi:hypothetical protein
MIDRPLVLGAERVLARAGERSAPGSAAGGPATKP